MTILLGVLPSLLVLLGGVVAPAAQLSGLVVERWEKKLSGVGIVLSLIGGMWTAIDDFRGGSELMRRLSGLTAATNATAEKLGQSLQLTERNLQLTEGSIRDVARVAGQTEAIQERASLTYELSSEIAGAVGNLYNDVIGDAFPFVYQFGEVSYDAGSVPTQADLAWSVRGGKRLHNLELEICLPVFLKNSGSWEFQTLARLEIPELWARTTPSDNLLSLYPSDLHKPLYLIVRAKARNGYWTQALLIDRLPNRSFTWRAHVEGVTITKDGEQAFQYLTASRTFPSEEPASPLLPISRELLDSLGVPERQAVLKDRGASLTFHGPYPE